MKYESIYTLTHPQPGLRIWMIGGGSSTDPSTDSVTQAAQKMDQSLRNICNYSAMKKGRFLLVADGNGYILTIVQGVRHEYPIEMDVFRVYRPAGVVSTEESAEGLDESILTIVENLLTGSSMGHFYIEIGPFSRRNQPPKWSKNILNNPLRKVIL